jgi:hypothetical protein
MESVLLFLSDIANSAVVVALIGGFVGAVGGALGAQHIAERAKRKDELLKELRSTNAATTVGFTICNSFIALKRQNVLPLHENFSRDKEKREKFLAKRRSAEIDRNQPFEFQADLRAISAPSVPMDTLKTQVFDRISAHARPLALVSVLGQTLASLDEAIGRRNALIGRFARGDVPKELVPNFYFGMALPSGDTNQEYPDTVAAIAAYTDDMIFFSRLLCTDLMSHGGKIKAVLAKLGAKDVPSVSTAEFGKAAEAGLLPPDDHYTDWLNSFVEQPKAVAA